MRKLIVILGLTILLVGCQRNEPPKPIPSPPLKATYKAEPLPGCKDLRRRGGSC